MINIIIHACAHGSGSHLDQRFVFLVCLLILLVLWETKASQYGGDFLINNFVTLWHILGAAWATLGRRSSQCTRAVWASHVAFLWHIIGAARTAGGGETGWGSCDDLRQQAGSGQCLRCSWDCWWAEPELHQGQRVEDTTLLGYLRGGSAGESLPVASLVQKLDCSDVRILTGSVLQNENWRSDVPQ